MENKLLSLVFAAVSFLGANAQDRIICLDSIGMKVTEEKYHTSRVIEGYDYKKTSYKVATYTAAGVLTETRYISDRDNVYSFNGPFNEYHPNGTYSMQVDYTKAGEQTNYFEWYDTGKPKAVGRYIPKQKKATEGPELRIESFWDANNVQTVTNGNGEYTTEFAKGRLVNGARDGIWTGKNTLNNSTYSETYSKGKLEWGESTDRNGIIRRYAQIEVRPEPKKGLQHFYSYISKNMRISEDANGKIVLQFIVEKDGTIDTIKVAQSIDESTDAEAIRVLKSYGNLEPGSQRGIPVRVLYSIPIKIEQH